MDFASDRCRACGATAEELAANALIQDLHRRFLAGDPGVIGLPPGNQPA
jgi:hypothetical protein